MVFVALVEGSNLVKEKGEKSLKLDIPQLKIPTSNESTRRKSLKIHSSEAQLSGGTF